MWSGAEVTAPRTEFRVPMRLAYVRTVSLCCLCSTIVSKHLRSRLFRLLRGTRNCILTLLT